MSDPYIPNFAKPLNQFPLNSKRIGLQGTHNSGKTWAAMTFPGPIVAYDFDNKMDAHKHRSDVHILPFHDPEWCIAKGKELKIDNMVSRDMIKRWDLFRKLMALEISKFQPGQTVLMDSWTMLQNNYDLWFVAHPTVSAESGKVDNRVFYKNKGDFSLIILEMFKGCKANLVWTFHESKEEDADGKPTGRYNPLMSGRIKEVLGQHFGDWYRQTAESEIGPDNKPTGKTLYQWQIKPNTTCKCCCSVRHLIDSNVMSVPANYSSLLPPKQKDG